MPRLNFFVAGAILLKRSLQNRYIKRIGILRSGVSSTCHFKRKPRKICSFFIFKDSFLKKVSHKSFVFELQSFNFEGSLAKKFRV